MEIINRKKLNELYESNESAEEIIQLFLQNSPRLIEDVEQSLLLDNQTHLEQICHKGIGQARYIASDKLESILLHIQNAERGRKEEYLDKLKKLVEQLQNERT